ncbi:MAG TPA: flagellar assembly peptidoglycan hydrolase FlgJ [Herbaspirillum sp.]|jgi:flagellar protein FlgJ
MAIDSSGKFNITSGLATDTSSISGLKNAVRNNPNSPEAIKAASKQFEAMFLNTVMKSMRAATPQDGPFDSEQTKTFTTMLDQQLSQTLAKRGVGLAEVLARQLTVNRGKNTLDAVQGTDSDAADADTNGAGAGTGIGSALNINGKSADSHMPLPFGLDRLSGRHGDDARAELLPINQALMDSDRNNGNSSRGKGQQRHGARPAHVEAFQANVTPAAEQASKTTGIPARFMMAQAALESGWGKHVIQNKDGTSSNNLFGIKATAGWKGKVVEATTTEYVHGVAVRKVEKFRAYDSYEDSFKDYASMLRNNPRYEKVLASAQDMSGFAQGLQRAGYATDPRYAEKLTRIIRQS